MLCLRSWSKREKASLDTEIWETCTMCLRKVPAKSLYTTREQTQRCLALKTTSAWSKRCKLTQKVIRQSQWLVSEKSHFFTMIGVVLQSLLSLIVTYGHSVAMFSSALSLKTPFDAGIFLSSIWIKWTCLKNLRSMRS